MERTKNTNKNHMKHGLATVFLFYAFDILFKPVFGFAEKL
jgi:hypothetical protein